VYVCVIYQNNGLIVYTFLFLSQLRALGAEGMVNEMIRHLQKAENLSAHSNMYLGTPTYNIVLHSLLEANEVSFHGLIALSNFHWTSIYSNIDRYLNYMQTDMVINIFKRMKSCGCPADVATYNIMIDCCSLIHSYKSACALVSMMIRDGFSPKAVTFTALMKVITKYLITILKVCCHCFSRTCYK
jgi:pentatricopeptide repeat protein